MAFREAQRGNDLFDIPVAGVPHNAVLDTINRVVDWAALRSMVAVAYDDSGRGRPGHDPVWLLKMLLLEYLYGLSDVQVARECGDRYSFRAFLGLSPADVPPDDTRLVRFRNRLRAHGLHEKLMAAINTMLAAQGIAARPGSTKIVDATLVRAAVAPPRRGNNSDDERDEPGGSDTKKDVSDSHIKKDVEPDDTKTDVGTSNDAKPLSRNAASDPDADWTIKNKRAHYGYKLHLAQDAATGLVTAHAVTKASVHDTNVLEQLLDGTEQSVLADKGYIDARRDARLRKKGTTPLVMMRVRKTMSASMKAAIKQINRAISRMRCTIEPTFANLKRWRRCGRAVYIGLVKVGEQLGWGITAVNLMVAHRWLTKIA
jgi:IS5 family transposase